MLTLLACAVDVEAPPPPRLDPTVAWNKRLRAVVTPDGRVDYDDLAADDAALRAYVGWIGTTEADRGGADEDSRLAWHLNAYNALVLWGVLTQGPLESVQDVPGPFGAGSGFFWKLRFLVSGERQHLHGYEQSTILATFQEVRAHAALNCASRGCPPLRSELYDGRRLDAQLDDQMRRWVAGGAVTLDQGAVEEGPVEEGAVEEGAEPAGAPGPSVRFAFSPIFDWYAEDFSAWAGAATPCEAVRPYAAPGLAAAIDAAPDCPHRFLAYDWALNRP